jgi:LysM repeat protein
LITGLIVTATVLGALVLSVRGQPTSITELPIPTVTFQSDFPSPVPTRGVTQPAVTDIAVEPSATPTPTPTICPIPPDWQRYSVGPFDTLNSIAQRFSLTPDQLAQMNCLDKPGVTTGQTIYVPGFKPTPTSVPCFPPFNWAIYIVRPGDTLNVIAARYGISTYTLMRANCLSTTYIYYGQALYVPPTYPIVTFVPTPIIPTFTPTPPIGSPTPTIPSTDTPTAIPTTPVITVTPGPSDTPGPTNTLAPTDTPAPTNTAAPTIAPTDTLAPPTVAPTEPPPATSTPAPLPTAAATP